MDNVQIRIVNVAQIKAAFALAPRLMTIKLNQAIMRSVLVIGRDSRRNTPVDTGRLRSSTFERFSNLRGEVGTNTNYDYYVHQGTRFQRAQPYLLRAVEGNQGTVEQLFTDAVNSVLSEIGNKT